ncbi:Uncharacterised protein [Mycobacteroides abscessus subsp. abscessus]|nr:Uncharacterised protein [Mycobacteroides abscessus subsp. abscessus]
MNVVIPAANSESVARRYPGEPGKCLTGARSVVTGRTVAVTPSSLSRAVVIRK